MILTAPLRQLPDGKSTPEGSRGNPQTWRLDWPAMNPDQLAEWIELGLRLAHADPARRERVMVSLRRAVEAQEVIAEFDWQLALRAGRPTKRYDA
jgi:hypothetical protein